MQGRCRKCGDQIHLDSHGHWCDNSGGDACGKNGRNAVHEDVFSEQWFYGFSFANADDSQPHKPVTDTAYLPGYDLAGQILDGIMFRCDIAPGGKLVVTVADKSKQQFKSVSARWLEEAQEYAELQSMFFETEDGGEALELESASGHWIPILWHMLGAGPRSRKRERGCRNRYAASPGSEPHQHLLDMKEAGLVIGDRPMGSEPDALRLFAATALGCRLIGLTQAETKNATED